MRLAFVKKKFSIYGGAERYLQTFIDSLLKAGHEIHIFANEWTETPGVVFHKIGVWPLGSLSSVASFNRNVAKAGQKGPTPDCTISFERTVGQDIYRAGEGCHAEWLDIRRGVEPLHKRLSFRINPLHRFMLRLERRIFTETPLIVANSEMVKRQIVKHYGVSEEKIVVIYNGVDLERFSPANRPHWREETRRFLGLEEKAKTLLFVGTGFVRKGLPTLLRAMARLNDEDLHLLVVGRGDGSPYRRLLSRHGLADRVRFLGPQKEIEKFYAAADLFVLPTLYDPFSNATIEALAAGLPVITSRNNGVAELVENGKEGFVLESLFDAGELAERIRDAMKNPLELGENARNRVLGFPIARATREFTEVIQKTRNGG
jgi:UDP-glucose:(heptosyl)LPS alpha-1,3-glucosyltransferase